MSRLTLAFKIICCSESLWRITFLATIDRMNGYWQYENLDSGGNGPWNSFDRKLCSLVSPSWILPLVVFGHQVDMVQSRIVKFGVDNQIWIILVICGICFTIISTGNHYRLFWNTRVKSRIKKFYSMNSSPTALWRVRNRVWIDKISLHCSITPLLAAPPVLPLLGEAAAVQPMLRWREILSIQTLFRTLHSAVGEEFME